MKIAAEPTVRIPGAVTDCLTSGGTFSSTAQYGCFPAAVVGWFNSCNKGLPEAALRAVLLEKADSPNQVDIFLRVAKVYSEFDGDASLQKAVSFFKTQAARPVDEATVENMRQGYRARFRQIPVVTRFRFQGATQQNSDASHLVALSNRPLTEDEAVALTSLLNLDKQRFSQPPKPSHETKPAFDPFDL